jgi:hypothetical protein
MAYYKKIKEKKMNINDFLVWLTGGGFIIAAAWILGKIPGYVTLADSIKQWIFFAVAIVFGCGAYAVTQYVAAVTLASFAPYFAIIAIAFGAIFLNKAYAKLVAIHQSLFKK